MTDLDKHVETFARAVATLGMTMIPAQNFHSFCEARGIRSIVLFEAFVERFPGWSRMQFGKGSIFGETGSAHDRLAWYQFQSEVRASEEVAS